MVQKSSVILLSALLLCNAAREARAAISIAGSTASWTAIAYLNPNASDPSNDQQTGSVEGDIVGNASHPAFYTAFYNGGTPSNLTDGEIGFRIRLAGDSNPPGLNTVVWVGFDANSDGNIDLFAGAKNQAEIGFYPAGNGANISPNTTSINSNAPFHEVAVSTLNFNFAPVTALNDPSATNFNLDGGSGGGVNHSDHFVSYKLSFTSLVAAINGLNLAGLGSGFNENSALRFIVATSTQANSLNQDLNGITGGTNSTSTWATLGGLTTPYSSSGIPVPEPAVPTFFCLTGLLLGLRRKRA